MIDAEHVALPCRRNATSTAGAPASTASAPRHARAAARSRGRRRPARRRPRCTAWTPGARAARAALSALTASAAMPDLGAGGDHDAPRARPAARSARSRRGGCRPAARALRGCCGSAWRVRIERGRARCARSPRPRPPRSRPHRRAATASCAEWRAGWRGARSAGASGRPRRGRSSRACRRSIDAHVHQARQAHRVARVVGEGQERAAVRNEAAVQRDAVHDRRSCRTRARRSAGSCPPASPG